MSAERCGLFLFVSSPFKTASRTAVNCVIIIIIIIIIVIARCLGSSLLGATTLAIWSKKNTPKNSHGIVMGSLFSAENLQVVSLNGECRTKVTIDDQ